MSGASDNLQPYGCIGGWVEHYPYLVIAGQGVFQEFPTVTVFSEIGHSSEFVDVIPQTKTRCIERLFVVPELLEKGDIEGIRFVKPDYRDRNAFYEDLRKAAGSVIAILRIGPNRLIVVREAESGFIREFYKMSFNDCLREQDSLTLDIWAYLSFIAYHEALVSLDRVSAVTVFEDGIIQMEFKAGNGDIFRLSTFCGLRPKHGASGLRFTAGPQDGLEF